MVRIYQRKFTNSRNGKNHSPYLSYSKEELQKAVEAIQNGSLRLVDAAKTFNVPKSTLSRKCRNINCTQEKAGHPTLFSKDEEMAFIKYIHILSNWGFPLDSTDLRIFAQKYLDKLGKTLCNLKDNMPGIDWARNFLIRHRSEISNRHASNITNERAKISPVVIDNFFSHYKKSIEDVSPDCIINYDETNLTDDPGNKKHLFKRGCKYPERVINTSKTSISLMFTGTADGQLLPIYVVYKADHLWDQWLEGGPEGTRYNRSKSGWFDSACFEDWFNSIIVPYAKTKTGRKVIIGDNLSSHFSQTVLRTCQDLNIIFVCLPPKTTHILQPLDVAFYAPLKKYWRDVLTQWKRTEGLKHKTLVKSSFPKLLYRLHKKLRENDSDSNNIIAGFNKCGLYPINSERPKSRLPQTNSEEHIQDTATSAVIEILQDMRNPTVNLEQSNRKKKCNVPPGKSITAEDIRVEKISTMKSRQRKKKYIGINRCSENIKTISCKSDRRESINLDIMRDISDDSFNVMQSNAGPSGLCNKKRLTTSIKENTGNESDSTYVSSQDEYETHEIKSQEPESSFKGKGKGKKSKIQGHSNNSLQNVGLQKNLRLNINATAKSKKKRYKRQSSVSTTSVSDIMSVHSDSDLLDINFDDQCSDINNWKDLSPSLLQQIDNSDEMKTRVVEEKIDDNDKTESYISNNIKNDEMRHHHNTIITLLSQADIKDNFDEIKNQKKEKPVSELNEPEKNNFLIEPHDQQVIESMPLFFLDDIESEEIVVGDDCNTLSLLSFNEKGLHNIDNIKNTDFNENKENVTNVKKRLTIIKDESIKKVFAKKKVVFNKLKPISLSSYINLPKKSNQKHINKKKDYYNDSQEILKVLMDSD